MLRFPTRGFNEFKSSHSPRSIYGWYHLPLGDITSPKVFQATKIPGSRYRLVLHSQWKKFHLSYRYYTSLKTLRKLSITNSPSSSLPGICGINNLHAPSDWDRLTRKTIALCDTITEKIKNYRSVPRSKIVALLDSLSNAICLIADPAELIVQLHPDREMVAAASRASSTIADRIVSYNTDLMLYEAVLHVLKCPNELNEEELSVADQLRIEFEHQGCQLESTKRRALHQIHADLHQSIAQYRDLMYDTSHEAPITDFSHIPNIPHIVQKLSHQPFAIKNDQVILDETNIGENLDFWKSLPSHIECRLSRQGSHWRIPTTDPIVTNYMLMQCPDSNVRQAIYFYSHCSDRKQTLLPLLDQFLQKRYTLSKLLNFPSYSHYYAWHRSLKTPTEIYTFLDKLREQVKPIVNENIETLKKLKMQEQKTNGRIQSLQHFQANSSVVDQNSSTHKIILLESDLAYYRQLHMNKMHSELVPTLEEYFTVPNLLRGFSYIWKTLFNIRIELDNNATSEIWHPDIFKFNVVDEETNRFLGSVYFDLFDRPNKPSAANFPIRIQCQHGRAMVGLVTNWPFKGQNRANQIPHLIPFDHVHVFFHELGHLLQALLCENQLQHFSGTRGLMDYVETPSQLFQHFATDYRVLRQFARHYKTGQVLPEELLEHVLDMKRCFAGIDVATQIFYSALDQCLHSSSFMEKYAGSSYKALECVHQQYYNLTPLFEGTLPQVNFTHLIGYGSTYYSYLHSGVHSSQIWHTIFNQNPLSREAGMHYRNELLKYGGARDPNIILKNLTGHDADPSHFIKDVQRGIH